MIWAGQVIKLEAATLKYRTQRIGCVLACNYYPNDSRKSVSHVYAITSKEQSIWSFSKIFYKAQFHLVTSNVKFSTHEYFYKPLTLCDLFISSQYETRVLQLLS
jgi:hypothetical protein